MLNQRNFIALMLSLIFLTSYAQKSSTSAPYFENPVLTDSSSTIMIPTIYNSSLFTTSKMDLWGDYYANIVFYNFVTDSYKKLFENDTYIIGFNTYRSYNTKPIIKNFSSQSIFYRVRNIDHNKNGRIDSNDPAILYVSDIHGDKLKALSTENENIISIDIFDKQNFALLKFQRDLDGDGDYEGSDKDYYFIKLDLTTMQFGKKVEVK